MKNSDRDGPSPQLYALPLFQKIEYLRSLQTSRVVKIRQTHRANQAHKRSRKIVSRKKKKTG